MVGDVAAKSSSHHMAHPAPRSAPGEHPVIPMEELGWTKAQVAEARRRLSSFAKEWEGEGDAEGSP